MATGADQPTAACSASGVSLRPLRPDDDESQLVLFASTRVDELASLPPDQAIRRAFLVAQYGAQLSHYRTWYPRATYDVVLLEGWPVGRLFVARSDSEVRVLDVALLPEHRNAGIGTGLMRAVLAEALSLGVPVRLHVESFNRSLRLFDRLGFVPVAENGFHVLMEWQPRLA
jgi:GNAT superfamily N-acetyltransferase